MDFSFDKDLEEMLNKLSSSSVPQWGKMQVVEMLEHLRQGIELSMRDEDRQLLIPEEKVASYQRFLISDKPFMRHAPKPSDYDRYAQAGLSSDIDAAKERLRQAVAKLQEFYTNNPGFSAVHPNFGRLDVSLWLALHKKHFMHHFSQFGLMDFA